MKNKKLIIYIFVILLIVLTFLFLGFKFFNNKENNIINNKPSNVVTKKIIPNFEDRKEQLSNFNFNNMFVLGWLQVQGTNVDLPIFTSMLPAKEENGLVEVDFSYGWRSGYYNLGENRMSIIGHNMLNVSSTPLVDNEKLTDFEDLMHFVYYDFAKDNLYIKYTKEDEENIYMIYAAGFYDYSEDVGQSYKNKIDINEYINNVKSRSIYNYDIDVNSDDEIISVVTCTRFFGLNYLNQFKLDARKVRDNEKVTGYTVSVNDNYKEVSEKLN